MNLAAGTTAVALGLRESRCHEKGFLERGNIAQTHLAFIKEGAIDAVCPLWLGADTLPYR